MKTFSLLSTSVALAVLGSAFLFPSAARSQTVLLQDDFNDETLDLSLWSTDTAPAPPSFFPRTVTESGGSITLMNRGYLFTAAEFDPAANEGIRITGTWQATAPGDELTVLTRSNALNSGLDFNVSQGIACHVRIGVPSSSIAIEFMEGGVATSLAAGDAAVAANETFRFEIIDDGLSVTFKLYALGSEIPLASATAEIDIDNPSDHVVFHNGAGNFYFAKLDEVTIESLAVEPDPEPEPEAPTPEELILETIEAINALGLPKGITNSLTLKLDNALLDLTTGDFRGAFLKLKTFIFQVKVQTTRKHGRKMRWMKGKKIAPADADALTEAAEEILALVLEEELNSLGLGDFSFPPCDFFRPKPSKHHWPKPGKRGSRGR